MVNKLSHGDRSCRILGVEVLLLALTSRGESIRRMAFVCFELTPFAAILPARLMHLLMSAAFRSG